jgi:ABC-type multidrug transport system ATPase subunit
MLTGVITPTAGEAFIAGYSVRTDLITIFKMLGYCPQFGGLFPRGLTLRGHLEAFGRLKGVPEAQLASHVARVLSEFGLEEHAGKWVTKLSGGTKRKLIAAIALSCDPKVCFLDEPTTGVDVGTRQFLWNRIKAKGERGCGLILTTHYMEEADALASRVGIMANGKLRVLGSPQHLKSEHGGGYRIELKGKAETAERARELIERLFPGSECLEAHGGYQVFEAGGAGGDGSRHGGRNGGSGHGGNNVGAHNGQPRSGGALFKLGPVFSALDEAKAELGLESYTLSQTTLEQVFLNIAAEQVDDEAPPPPGAAATSSAGMEEVPYQVVAAA